MQDDKFFMRRALALARKGLGQTSPNPMVGAVVVKGNEIVGMGYHKKAGSEHAEIYALREAGNRAQGATLYINLEPCAHFGRTPPCAEAIIKSGVKRVVAAMKDPNPLNNGRGFKRLRDADVEVTAGILEEEAKRLNEAFIRNITTKRPFVIAKAAQSLDGKIATRAGDSKWISCEESRRFVHRLRSQVDAVMVGARTVITDDPVLTSREAGRGKGQGLRVKKKQPLKIVVDSKLKIPVTAKIFSKESPAKVILATTKSASKNKIKQFEKRGVKILVLSGKDGKVDLRMLMQKLGKMEITSILVEGGGKLVGSLVDEKLIDKFLFFISPKIIGGRDAITSVEGEGVKKIKQASYLKNLQIKRIGSDILVSGYLTLNP